MPRNRFEDSIAALLPATFSYESHTLTYTLPPARYTPDWVSADHQTIIEAKGLWRPEDRRKCRLIREQHPRLRMIIVFQNPGRTISKRSRTTYWEWAKRIGLEVMSLDDLPGL